MNYRLLNPPCAPLFTASPLQQRVIRSVGSTSITARGLLGARPNAIELLSTLDRTPGSSPGSAASLGGRPRLPLQRLDLSLNSVGNGEGAAALGKMLSKVTVSVVGAGDQLGGLRKMNAFLAMVRVRQRWARC